MTPDQFWTYVQTGTPDDCWPWTAGASEGRGRVHFNGRTQYAYRVAVELATGTAIPADQMGCHSCDNPICVNPAHIFIGTARDNSRDAAAKGRLRHTPVVGQAHHNATLSAKQVAQAIAEYRAGGRSQAEVARRYGVTQQAVSYWLRGATRADARGAAA